ncbi:MAG: hypothetical protein NTY45_06500 [Elusimicrobia bacterium]|nr:hypothetical protein [Elusimicrobiota bacterium]
MKYTRPRIETRLSKEEKVALMRDYIEYYKHQYAANPAFLNTKIPRKAFEELTNQIGALLLKKSTAWAKAGEVSKFLHANPLPHSMRVMLPREIRAFCLALNALKQWVSAEQSAMDRLILGGTAKATCRAATPHCIVTGQELDAKTLNLHHPVRDGRPPLPLSKAGHDKIESQGATTETDPVREILLKLKHDGNRSWVMLRRGCLDLLGRTANHSTLNVGSNSKTFARKAKEVSGLDYEQILHWLDQKGYGF